tara:strand:+ start:737 stop:1183 length:447 start_codon:yes stop_codon:yes gene_type:complete
MPDSPIPTDTKASPELVEELRSFLVNRNQRTPQEAIGVEDSGSLLSSLVVSTVGFVVLVGLLTTISFFTTSDETAASTETPAAVTSDQPEAEDNQQPATTGSQTNTNAPVANPDEVIDKLNIGDTKVADPDTNPLDNPNLNRLLDGDK